MYSFYRTIAIEIRDAFRDGPSLGQAICGIVIVLSIILIVWYIKKECDR